MLALKTPKLYNIRLMFKIVKNPAFRKYFSVFVCLVMFGNVSQGVVVCFGRGGHVAIEGALHGGHCGETAHDGHSHSQTQSFDHAHHHDNHCQPCVDVPIPVHVAKVSSFSQYRNFVSFTPAFTTNVRADLAFSAFSPTSDHNADSPYFIGLRTVIILC
jgi:hypothetical protein